MNLSYLETLFNAERIAVTDVAQRMRAIAPFRVMEILARARAMEAAGRDIMHMEIGEPTSCHRSR